ncbi:MAG: hypothetical protein HY965_04090, partial [Ignavibacteriales bacterium]|nr:hypothetical protein [Ignavibacteriales bacterium]
MRGIVPFYSRWCLLLFVLLSNSLTLAQWSSDPTVNTPVVVVGNNQSSQKMVSDGYGGTIVGWLDYRNGGYETYVQKLNASGVPQWTTNGVQITNSANHDNTTITLASDGHGGVVVSWTDTRNASYDIYAQRVDSTGNKVWAASGLSVCNNNNYQGLPAICTTGDGVIISWTDQRNGGANGREMAIFAQKLDINGTAQWTANGVQVIDLPQSQSNTKIVHDGANGALVA